MPPTCLPLCRKTQTQGGQSHQTLSEPRSAPDAPSAERPHLHVCHLREAASPGGRHSHGNVYFKKAFDPKAKFRVKRPRERAFRRFSSDSLGILSQGSPLQSWKMSVQVPGHLQVAPCFLAVLKSDPRLPLGYLAHCQART